MHETGGRVEQLTARSPGPWVYVALRQEYDIANYLVAQRAKLDGADSTFKFTYYDKRVDAAAAGFVPKVGCIAFYSRVQSRPPRGCFASSNTHAGQRRSSSPEQ